MPGSIGVTRFGTKASHSERGWKVGSRRSQSQNRNGPAIPGCVSGWDLRFPKRWIRAASNPAELFAIQKFRVKVPRNDKTVQLIDFGARNLIIRLIETYFELGGSGSRQERRDQC